MKDVRPGPEGSSPGSLADVGGTLFFTAHDGTGGRELWKSDGTASDTILVEDIWPGSGESLPYFLTDVGGTLFFVANDGIVGEELWSVDPPF